MNEKCAACGGTGSVPKTHQPYGFNRTAGMGLVVCKSCGGTGKGKGRGAPLPKTHPVIWFFGLTGAFFAGVLKPLDTDWFINAVLGFVVVGMVAGFLMGRPYGRIILAILGLCIVALFGFAIYRAETGQIGP